MAYIGRSMNKISESVLKFFHLDNLVQNLTGYVEDRIELMKIEIREDVAKAMARTLLIVVLFLLGFLFLVFLSVGLAHFLNSFFDASYAGYWLVAGIYGLIFLILFIARKAIYHSFESHLSGMMKSKSKKHGTA